MLQPVARALKLPKHRLLSYGAKTLNLIQTLNRLRHCVSYSRLKENDTALYLQKMGSKLKAKSSFCQRVYIFNKTCLPNLAWDNIDRLKETLTGEGTAHRVNGIVAQLRVYGAGPQVYQQL